MIFFVQSFSYNLFPTIFFVRTFSYELCRTNFFIRTFSYKLFHTNFFVRTFSYEFVSYDFFLRTFSYDFFSYDFFLQTFYKLFRRNCFVQTACTSVFVQAFSYTLFRTHLYRAFRADKTLVRSNKESKGWKKD